MTTVLLHAANIKCDGCAQRIKDGITPLPGVSSVSVEVSSGQVRIEGEHPDEASIRETLSSLGYPAKDEL